MRSLTRHELVAAALDHQNIGTREWTVCSSTSRNKMGCNKQNTDAKEQKQNIYDRFNTRG